jgi:flagellum-specific peptidoglycan hydrolase FlgJ
MARAATRSEQIAFIKNVAGAAMLSHKKWDVPASITIAQAILESGWGLSDLAIKANNFFGVKARQGDDYGEFLTTEYVQGIAKKELAKFARYPSAVESFDAHGKLLATLSRYKPAMCEADDPLGFALGLQQCGYSTDPKYANQLAILIKQFNLTRFDSQQEQQKEASA